MIPVFSKKCLFQKAQEERNSVIHNGAYLQVGMPFLALPLKQRRILGGKEIGDEEPYYSPKISIFSFIWAGLAALHKVSTI